MKQVVIINKAGKNQKDIASFEKLLKEGYGAGSDSVGSWW